MAAPESLRKAAGSPGTGNACVPSLRANGLGDFIVILPAVQAIRAAYPAAGIVLPGKPWHAAFLRQLR